MLGCACVGKLHQEELKVTGCTPARTLSVLLGGGRAGNWLLHVSRLPAANGSESVG